MFNYSLFNKFPKYVNMDFCEQFPVNSEVSFYLRSTQVVRRAKRCMCT